MLPPANYSSGTPALSTVGGRRFFRIYKRWFTPLGVGHGLSRFSDPRTPPLFAVAYFGASVEVCFVEAILRDRRNGVLGQLPISRTDLDDLVCAEVEVASGLDAFDLTGANLLRNGVPTDVVRASDQTLARQWSIAFHEHPVGAGGVLYESRLISQVCFAVYDRALPQLTVNKINPLLQLSAEMAHILRTYQLAIVP